MTPIEILKFFGECGLMFKRSEIESAIRFLDYKIKNNRILKVYDDNKLLGVLVYSLTDIEVKHLVKSSWEIVEEAEDGKIIYIDYLMAKKFDIDLRNEIRNYFKTNHPQYEYGIWKRYKHPVDRIVREYKERLACTR